MSESFAITFSSFPLMGVIDDIKYNIEGLEYDPETEEYFDEEAPEIIVSTSGAEAEIENFLLDVLDEVQRQATTNEKDYDNHK